MGVVLDKFGVMAFASTTRSAWFICIPSQQCRRRRRESRRGPEDTARDGRWGGVPWFPCLPAMLGEIGRLSQLM